MGWGEGGDVSVGEQFNTAFAMCRQGESMWDGERVGMFLWESSLTQRLPCVDKERCVGWGEGGDVSVGEQFNTAFAMCRQGESMWDGERVGMFL